MEAKEVIIPLTELQMESYRMMEQGGMKQVNVSVLPLESELKVDSSRVIEKEDLSAISMGIQENKEAENAFFA